MTDEQVIARVAEIFAQCPEQRAKLIKVVIGVNMHAVRLTAARDQALARLGERRDDIKAIADGTMAAPDVGLVRAMACFVVAELFASAIDAHNGIGGGA